MFYDKVVFSAVLSLQAWHGVVRGSEEERCVPVSLRDLARRGL
jgi:hypothetical protein